MSNSPIVNLGLNADDFKRALVEIAEQTKSTAQIVKEAFASTTQSFTALNERTQAQEQSIANLTNTYIRLQTQAQRTAEGQQRAIVEHTNQMVSALNQINNSLRGVGTQGTESTSQIVNGTRRATREMKELNSIAGVVKKGLDYLQWTITRVFYFGAVLKFQEALHGVVTEGMAFEQAVAGLTSATNGNVQEAEKMFMKLNQIATEVNFSVDELVKTSLILNKNGFQPTEATLKSLATIAGATKQSMFTLATAMSSAVKNNFRGLNMMGINAKRVGDDLQLTFMGQTKTIKANTAELAKYIQELAKLPRFADVTNQMMNNTVTGAQKKLSESWADFSRQIYFSGAGDFLIRIFDKSREALVKLTDYLSSGEGIEFLNQMLGTIELIFDTVMEIPSKFGKGLDEIRKAVSGLIVDNSDYAETFEITWADVFKTISHGIIALGSVFEFVGDEIGLIFSTLTAGIKKAFYGMLSGIIVVLQAIVNIQKEIIDTSYTALQNMPVVGGITQLLDNFNPHLIDKGFDYVNKRLIETQGILADNSKSWVDSYGGYFAFLTSQTTNNLDKMSDKYMDKLKEFDDKIDKQIADTKKRVEGLIKANKDADGGTEGSGVDFADTGTGKGKGGKGRAKQIRDTWTKFYENLVRQHSKTLPKMKQIDLKYADDLMELERKLNENVNVNAVEAQNAKKLIDKMYIEEKKKLQEEAYNFTRGIMDKETLDLDLKYEKELAKLKEYYDQKLIGETEYQTALTRIREEYATDRDKTEADKLQKELDKYDYSKIKSESVKQGWEQFRRMFGEESTKNVKSFQTVMAGVSDVFGSLTENMDKSSSSYKTMFAMQKAFAFATASVDAVMAWMKALADPLPGESWTQRIANYMSAMALTTSAISQLSSISLHDRGGFIPNGQYGIVGELGPELVRGPMSVTSRRSTAEALRNSKGVTVNLIEDNSRAGQVTSEENQEETVIQICVANIRRGGEIAEAMSSTYGLARQGI